MSNPTILPAIGPDGTCFDYLEYMDDETLDALSELLELRARGAGLPIFVLPRGPRTLQ